MAVENEAPDVAASSIVSQVISSWRSSAQQTPDATRVLAQYPQLHRYDSLVMDLAYEEFCLRREAGEAVQMSTFCDRFPTVADSLRILLSAHECIEEDGGSLYAQEQWPELNTHFLGFDLIRELGRGTFARVYLATQPALGDRRVVVKVSQRGQGEAETLGRIAHRNIVPVFSIQEDAATLLSAICMPYLGSGTLFNVTSAIRTARGPRPRAALFLDAGRQDTEIEHVPAEFVEVDPFLVKAPYADGVAHIAAQLADALAYAHDQGICHRDLKPSNILLSPSGRPLLLDFNLSSDDRLERTLVGGTLPYMPPEQLRCVADFQAEEAETNDPRSDIFSLGVILFELLTGQLPFGDQTPHEAAGINAMRILAQQTQGCPHLARLVPDIHPALAKIIQKCLRWDPAERFSSARELALRLRAA